MATLSVNINKVATIRNARGGNNPNVLQTALDLIRFGAEGITVHPRPDERHIRKTDVFEVAQKVDVEFNIEGYPSNDFIDMVLEVRPAQVTLVPDPPDVLTSNAGWKISENKELLKDVVQRLKTSGARVSLFYDPYDLKDDEMKMIRTEIEADRIELYTEMYARAYSTPEKESVTEVYAQAAQAAYEAGLGINAGHDLDRENLPYFAQNIPHLAEVSIGHALVCDALYLGWEETIKQYLRCLKP